MAGTPEECVARLKELERAGIGSFLLTLPPKGYGEVMKMWAEAVMPHFSS
jgi:alkanesulfonate monooxygenase SsuD/methylene tetrahydromethanopterin reductase-like flavin-dependent oxidoreductase (luciferase family)